MKKKLALMLLIFMYLHNINNHCGSNMMGNLCVANLMSIAWKGTNNVFTQILNSLFWLSPRGAVTKRNGICGLGVLGTRWQGVCTIIS